MSKISETIFLKFVFDCTLYQTSFVPYCYGTPSILLYDEKNEILSKERIVSIPYDDFVIDERVRKELFLPVDKGSIACRAWRQITDKKEIYFIVEVNVKGIEKISKISICQWGNTSVPNERIKVYWAEELDKWKYLYLFTFNSSVPVSTYLSINTNLRGVYVIEFKNLNKDVQLLSFPDNYICKANTIPESLEQPISLDCEFVDWYEDTEYKTLYELKPITQNKTLYAKWIPKKSKTIQEKLSLILEQNLLENEQLKNYAIYYSESI